MSGLFGFAAWTTLLKRHTAASVTPFALLVPVFGIASAALLLGERPSALELGGAVLICAGLAATLLPARSAAPRRRRSPPRPPNAPLTARSSRDVIPSRGTRRSARPGGFSALSPRRLPLFDTCACNHTAGMLRLALLDDHPATLDGLRALLELDPESRRRVGC